MNLRSNTRGNEILSKYKPDNMIQSCQQQLSLITAMSGAFTPRSIEEAFLYYEKPIHDLTDTIDCLYDFAEEMEENKVKSCGNAALVNWIKQSSEAVAKLKDLSIYGQLPAQKNGPEIGYIWMRAFFNMTWKRCKSAIEDADKLVNRASGDCSICLLRNTEISCGSCYKDLCVDCMKVKDTCPFCRQNF